MPGSICTVLKTVFKRSLFLMYVFVGLLVLSFTFAQPVRAAGTPQVDISMPNSPQLIGQIGSKVHLTGSGFPANATVDLFTTPKNDPTKCTPASLKNPGGAGLASFTTTPKVNADGQGSFQLDTTWPSNANIATTNYYICAIAEGSTGGSGGASVLSSKSFTVAQPLELGLSNPNVQPGGTVTITGSGWLPPQQLTVSLIGDPGNVLTSTTVPASAIDGMTGNFTATLTVPANADPRDYSVQVVATNDPSMTKTMSNAITVGGNSSTDTTPTAASTTPTAQAATPTATPANGGDQGGPNILVLGLGGLGAILVVVGIAIYVVYSRQSKQRR
jgi:hypothetical protein